MEATLQEAEVKMDKALDSYKHELTGIRTGRANPAILEGIKVDVYGQSMPLTQVASINAPDHKTLQVVVWDANNTKAVDAAIRTSDMGFNPRIEGNKLFVPLPELSAERRQELVKLVKKKAEDTKVAVRNIRRDANDDFKKKEKDKDISEDDLHQALEKIQSFTDAAIVKIDQSSENKQKELLTI